MNIREYLPKKHIMLCMIAIAGISLCSLASCKDKEQTVDANPLSSPENAALFYYNSLISGDYETFANGIASSDLGGGYSKGGSLPEAYRHELADVAGQFAVKETKKHGGIASVEVISTNLEADSVTALVSLELIFGDNTHEEILLAMHKAEGIWKMK